LATGQTFLLHGFLGSPKDFEGVAGVALDLCHYAGQSHDFESGLLCLVDDIRGRYGVGPHRWVGYSLGGRVALGVAVLYPELVSELVMISASPGIENIDERQKRRRADWELADDIVSATNWERFIDDWYAQPLFGALAQQSFYEELKRERLVINRVAQAQLLRVFGVGGQPSFWGDLSSLSAQLKVVTGEEDQKYKEIAIKMQIVLPKLSWIEIPGGHYLLKTL